MSSVKITELTSSGPLTGSEVLPIVQGSQTVKTTAQDIANLAGGGLEGTQYVYVAGNGTPEENGDELKAAYATAQTMFPTSTNRVTVIVGPGKYFNSSPAIFPLADGQFEFLTDYIDVISLTGNPDVFLSGISVGGLSYIKGMNTSEALSLGGVQAGFNLIDSLVGVISVGQKIENCVGGNYSFGFGGNVNGTFINCIGGSGSFASVTTSSPPMGITDLGIGNIGGIFINCEAGSNSFGNYTCLTGANNLTGTFTNCKAGSSSFGNDQFIMGGATLSGLFTNCSAGPGSFGGGQSSILAGTFTNCNGGFNSFGGDTSGVFNNCDSGDYSFSSSGKVASGIYTNCKAGDYSFGPGTGLNAIGTFTYCKAGDWSFGSGIGTFTNCEAGSNSFGASNLADGTYNKCIAGSNSFGTNMGPSISGQLYFCRLTSGTFQTVTGAGKTVYCVDGNGDPNNQGFTAQNNL
jgi:hypothetical protein